MSRSLNFIIQSLKLHMYAMLMTVACTVPEKTMTQSFIVNIQKKERKKKREKIRATSLGLSLTIQSLSLHKYAMFKDCSLHSS